MKTKTWCRHIKWQPKNFCNPKEGSHWWTAFTITVPRSWNVCPICQAERPTKSNIAAADLRARMDGEQ